MGFINLRDLYDWNALNFHATLKIKPDQLLQKNQLILHVGNKWEVSKEEEELLLNNRLYALKCEDARRFNPNFRENTKSYQVINLERPKLLDSLKIDMPYMKMNEDVVNFLASVNIDSLAFVLESDLERIFGPVSSES